MFFYWLLKWRNYSPPYFTYNHVGTYFQCYGRSNKFIIFTLKELNWTYFLSHVVSKIPIVISPCPAGPMQCIKWPFITNFPHPLISPPLLIRIISTVFEGCWRIAGMCQLKRLVESGDWVGNLCVLSSKFQCNICQCLNLPLTCVDVFKVCKLSIPWKLIW